MRSERVKPEIRITSHIWWTAALFFPLHKYQLLTADRLALLLPGLFRLSGSVGLTFRDVHQEPGSESRVVIGKDSFLPPELENFPVDYFGP